MEQVHDQPVQGQPVQKQEVKTSDWFITLLIAAIPLVGLIMMFVWAFGNTAQPCKANWAKAMLIWLAVGIGLFILLSVVFGVAVFGML